MTAFLSKSYPKPDLGTLACARLGLAASRFSSCACDEDLVLLSLGTRPGPSLKQPLVPALDKVTSSDTQLQIRSDIGQIERRVTVGPSPFTPGSTALLELPLAPEVPAGGCPDPGEEPTEPGPLSGAPAPALRRRRGLTSLPAAPATANLAGGGWGNLALASAHSTGFAHGWLTCPLYPLSEFMPWVEKCPFPNDEGESTKISRLDQLLRLTLPRPLSWGRTNGVWGPLRGLDPISDAAAAPKSRHIHNTMLETGSHFRKGTERAGGDGRKQRPLTVTAGTLPGP
ncbi:uncharacterized protein [Gorilla gorilla gorilla]|uniref:uncharacterized protein n=1 Tax=Gorilla gorilla gorilla TaxID=9595 RepID=UPI00244576D9|nr:uncharacterized protein LOC129523918 [Gorilla gorilla gorilla]